jgi:DNA-binding IclR family transcriptional regulator
MTEARTSVASRLLSVLGAVERAGGPLQVSQIAERTGLPIATAWRMVRELVEWGGVEQQADGRYRLATRVWAIGSSAPCVRRIQHDTSRHLRELVRETGRSAHLCVLDQGSALVVSVAESHRGVTWPLPREGDRLDDTSSAAMIFAAFGGTYAQQPDALRAIRQQNVALSRSAVPPSSSMSVGIANPAGAVVAALTLTGGRDDPWQRLHPALVRASRSVRYSIYRDELVAG